MRIRTRADNKQLGEDEVQIEDLQGAIPTFIAHMKNGEKYQVTPTGLAKPLIQG